MKSSPVRQAIIVDGQIVGWREIAPIRKKIDLTAWAKSSAGQELYTAARLSTDADGQGWMSLRPAISRKTGKPYWQRYDPEMYE